VLLPKSLFTRHKWSSHIYYKIIGQELTANNIRCAYLSPKPIAIHIFVVIAKWGICKRSPFNIHIIKLSHVSPDNLVCINEYNLQIYELHKYKFSHIIARNGLSNRNARCTSKCRD